MKPYPYDHNEAHMKPMTMPICQQCPAKRCYEAQKKRAVKWQRRNRAGKRENLIINRTILKP